MVGLTGIKKRGLTNKPGYGIIIIERNKTITQKKGRDKKMKTIMMQNMTLKTFTDAEYAEKFSPEAIERNAQEREIREKKAVKEAEAKEANRIAKKAIKLNITPEEVITLENNKKLQAKRKRYMQDIEKLEKELAYKKAWLANNLE